jgi:hypothetical protein
MNKTSLVFAFFVAALLAGLFARSNMAPLPTRESFAQKEAGMPLNSAGMGPYDGVSIGGGVSGWSANEAVSVEGGLPSQPSDSNKLMLMVGNKVDSACCPAAFNTDTGCVCLTQSDKNMFAHRGGNRT